MYEKLQWRHSERYGISHHRGLDFLLNRLLRRRPKKASKLRVTDRWIPLTNLGRNIFPFDDVIMIQMYMPTVDWLSASDEEE